MPTEEKQDDFSDWWTGAIAPLAEGDAPLDLPVADMPVADTPAVDMPPVELGDGEPPAELPADLPAPDWVARLGLALALEQSGRLKDALHELNAALRAAPVADCLIARGRIQYYLGNGRQATRDLTRALMLRPGVGEALFFLARCMFLEGQLLGARAAYQAAIEADVTYDSPALRSLFLETAVPAVEEPPPEPPPLPSEEPAAPPVAPPPPAASKKKQRTPTTGKLKGKSRNSGKLKDKAGPSEADWPSPVQGLRAVHGYGTLVDALDRLARGIRTDPRTRFVLLFGPSGSGKGFMARCLAHHVGGPILYTRGEALEATESRTAFIQELQNAIRNLGDTTPVNILLEEAEQFRPPWAHAWGLYRHPLYFLTALLRRRPTLVICTSAAPWDITRSLERTLDSAWLVPPPDPIARRFFLTQWLQTAPPQCVERSSGLTLREMEQAVREHWPTTRADWVEAALQDHGGGGSLPVNDITRSLDRAPRGFVEWSQKALAMGIHQTWPEAAEVLEAAAEGRYRES